MCVCVCVCVCCSDPAHMTEALGQSKCTTYNVLFYINCNSTYILYVPTYVRRYGMVFLLCDLCVYVCTMIMRTSAACVSCRQRFHTCVFTARLVFGHKVHSLHPVSFMRVCCYDYSVHVSCCDHAVHVGCYDHVVHVGCYGNTVYVGCYHNAVLTVQWTLKSVDCSTYINLSTKDVA